MATINICSNITNGIGLQADYELLRAFLERRGHTVNGIQWTDSVAKQPHADLQIWLEVIAPHLLSLAPEHWLIVNPEWFRTEWLSEVLKPRFTKMLCKTRDAYDIMDNLTAKAHYIGFQTKDRRDPTIPRERKFLHVGGNGGHRNTQAVVEAWSMYRYYDGVPKVPLQLTVVSKKFNDVLPDVTFHSHVSDAELVRLQNSHLFHLYPSAYEGFGHALHEAQGVGAIVLTTDAPPMNEFGCPFTIPSMETASYNQGIIHRINPMDLHTAASDMMKLPEEDCVRLSAEARQRFEAGNAEFEELFGRELKTIGKTKIYRPVGKRTKPPTETRLQSPIVSAIASEPAPKEVTILEKRKLTVAILGNHSVSYCTERELDWTFEHLGHKVIPFNETTANTNAMLTTCIENKVDLFLYIHTHGVIVSGDLPLAGLFDLLKENGITTASFHLDRFWGLGKKDGREASIGNIPFWKTDFVFSPDGGNAEKFKERGVNHIWLPPAVVERGCHWGVPRDKFRADVIFVGQKSYHPEYPFRIKLIEFLEKAYGRGFKRFAGDAPSGTIREQDLNDVYASAKITVGDCCFAGEPFYWSDRAPEALGRGAFLIHPDIPGLRIPGLVTYKPQDLEDLRKRIDYYLPRDDKRRELQKRSFEYVRRYETYTNRVIEMLEIMGLV